MNRWEILLQEYMDFVVGTQPQHYEGALLKFVTCEETPSEVVSQTLDIVHPEVKACYDNSFTSVCFLKDATYCLGYTLSNRVPIAIEHAWIKHDGKYYDPTFLWHNRQSAPDDCAYMVLHEFNRQELLAFLKLQEADGGDVYPPDMLRVMRLGHAARIAA